jgi:hypothetical protein
MFATTSRCASSLLLSLLAEGPVAGIGATY